MEVIHSLLVVACFRYTVSYVSVQIDVDKVLQNLDDQMFLGTAFDTLLLKNHWENFDTSSRSVQTLGRALSPSYFRIGGTTADFMVFQDGDKESMEAHPKRMQNFGQRLYGKLSYDTFNLTAQMFDQLYNFTSSVGWDMIYNLNALLRQKDGSWDPSNALKLFNYVTKKNYKIRGWELGNEPDLYGEIKVSPEQMAADFRHLVQILSGYPQFKNCLIMGPSVAGSVSYFKRFFEAGAAKIVTTASFHHYYFGTPSVDEFINPGMMDSLIERIAEFKLTANVLAPEAQVWLAETSTDWTGGQAGWTDRYLAGFLWLDKLGLSAKYGLDVILRQCFYGFHFSLINHEDLKPNPDYWLTLLYKNLVGGKVLSATTDDSTGKVRVYAHCTNHVRSPQYKPGTVIVYIMNLNLQAIELNLPQAGQDEFDVYLLQSAPAGAVFSRDVSLNGVTLVMQDEEHLPDLKPNRQTGHIVMPPLTMAFIVLPTANVTVCY
ncbi:hypothetical protein ACJMK2_005381 [Sinanodonta woodiana]|uniref:Heparanase n=1 Tax=Sinanodonta woodiana TaxID=1069815 RepID=A0ABD3VPV7_SINWO